MLYILLYILWLSLAYDTTNQDFPKISSSSTFEQRLSIYPKCVRQGKAAATNNNQQEKARNSSFLFLSASIPHFRHCLLITPFQPCSSPFLSLLLLPVLRPSCLPPGAFHLVWFLDDGVGCILGLGWVVWGG